MSGAIAIVVVIIVPGSSVDVLRASIGAAAKLTVRATDHGLRLARWMAPPADKASPGIAPAEWPAMPPDLVISFGSSTKHCSLLVAETLRFLRRPIVRLP
jgi:hypothetical protein